MKRHMAFALILVVAALPLAWVLAADKPTSPPKAPTIEKTEDPKETLLETTGALAGAQLYQSYLNIGFIADGKAEGTYTEAEVIKILDSILTLLDKLDERLQRVSKLDIERDDAETIEQMRLLSALLRQQGDELKAFWKTEEKVHSEKYDKARKEAWEGISKLLNLEE